MKDITISGFSSPITSSPGNGNRTTSPIGNSPIGNAAKDPCGVISV